jgi:PhnB protein
MAITTSIAPWLSIKNAGKAVAFYKTAFGAEETYRMEEGGLVVRLSVNGAEFWVSGELDAGDAMLENIGSEHIKMILTVAEPDILFRQAVQAGATEIFPVGEEYGWRLGRLEDPFGLHWEIGYELAQKQG